MIVKLFNPDREYARLLAEHGNCEKIVKFLRLEANYFVKLKSLLDICTTDEDYKELLPKMVEASGHIRNNKLHCMRKQFGFFEFRQKRFLKKLLEDLNR